MTLSDLWKAAMADQNGGSSAAYILGVRDRHGVARGIAGALLWKHPSGSLALRVKDARVFVCPTERLWFAPATVHHSPDPYSVLITKSDGSQETVAFSERQRIYFEDSADLVDAIAAARGVTPPEPPPTIPTPPPVTPPSKVAVQDAMDVAVLRTLARGAVALTAGSDSDAALIAAAADHGYYAGGDDPASKTYREMTSAIGRMCAAGFVQALYHPHNRYEITDAGREALIAAGEEVEVEVEVEAPAASGEPATPRPLVWVRLPVTPPHVHRSAGGALLAPMLPGARQQPVTTPIPRPSLSDTDQRAALLRVGAFVRVYDPAEGNVLPSEDTYVVDLPLKAGDPAALTLIASHRYGASTDPKTRKEHDAAERAVLNEMAARWANDALAVLLVEKGVSDPSLKWAARTIYEGGGCKIRSVGDADYIRIQGGGVYAVKADRTVAGKLSDRKLNKVSPVYVEALVALGVLIPYGKHFRFAFDAVESAVEQLPAR